jgi:integrase
MVRSRDGRDGIKLRGGIYYENFSVNGRQFRGSLKTGDRDIAKTLVAAKRAAALLGVATGKKPEITVAAAVIRHWNEYAQHWRTAYQAQIHNRTLVDELGANTLLSDLDFNRLSAFVAGRRAHLENASVNRETGHLRAIVNACDEWGYNVPKLPWRSSRGPNLWLDEPENRQTIVSEDTEEALLAALREDFRPVARFAIVSGVRRENALALRWTQIDWQAETITFRTKSKKPGGKLHVIALTERLKAILSRERGNHPEFVFTYICRHTVPSPDPERLRRRGERYPMTLDGQNFRRDWVRARQAVGLPELRFHDLRHTAGTRITRQRGIKAAQKLLGHADLRTTERYAAFELGDLREAMEAVDRTAQISHKGFREPTKKIGGTNG